MAPAEEDKWTSVDEGIKIALTKEPLDVTSIIADVRSPKAGATVLFAGKYALLVLKPLLSVLARNHS